MEAGMESPKKTSAFLRGTEADEASPSKKKRDLRKLFKDGQMLSGKPVHSKI